MNYINTYTKLVREATLKNLQEQKDLFESQRPLNYEAGQILQLIEDEIEIREIEQTEFESNSLIQMQ